MTLLRIENPGGGKPALGINAVNVFRSYHPGHVALYVNVEDVAGCQLTPAEARSIATALLVQAESAESQEES